MQDITLLLCQIFTSAEAGFISGFKRNHDDYTNTVFSSAALCVICLSAANSTSAASGRRKHYFKQSSRQEEFTGSTVMERLKADSMKQRDGRDNDTSAESFVR